MATPLLPVINLNKGFRDQCEFGPDKFSHRSRILAGYRGVVPVMVIYLTAISVTEPVLSGWRKSRRHPHVRWQPRVGLGTKGRPARRRA